MRRPYYGVAFLIFIALALLMSVEHAAGQRSAPAEIVAMAIGQPPMLAPPTPPEAEDPADEDAEGGTDGSGGTGATDDKRDENDDSSLEGLANPYSLQGVMNWLAERGPKILVIVVIFLLVRWLIRFGAHRMIGLIIRTATSGSANEREARARTLVGVFQNTAMAALYIGSGLMLLDTVGIPIAPLLGGVAVVGLAVAFGTQNLIKDYFHGFMILLEDQYHVNDVVEIGGVTGLVERITLRMTVLRSFDAVHFIPHGQITTVSNLTYQWSRAVMDIGVGYGEDVDRVIELIKQIGKEMREDPEFGKLILDDLDMFGVDALGDSAVVIKCLFKTEPIQQWTVKREMLRRVKKAFDEQGIEIPFPQRTVHIRQENADSPK